MSSFDREPTAAPLPDDLGSVVQVVDRDIHECVPKPPRFKYRRFWPHEISIVQYFEVHQLHQKAGSLARTPREEVENMMGGTPMEYAKRNHLEYHYDPNAGESSLTAEPEPIALSASEPVQVAVDEHRFGLLSRLFSWLGNGAHRVASPVKTSKPDEPESLSFSLLQRKQATYRRVFAVAASVPLGIAALMAYCPSLDHIADASAKVVNARGKLLDNQWIDMLRQRLKKIREGNSKNPVYELNDLLITLRKYGMKFEDIGTTDAEIRDMAKKAVASELHRVSGLLVKNDVLEACQVFKALSQLANDQKVSLPISDNEKLILFNSFRAKSLCAAQQLLSAPPPAVSEEIVVNTNKEYMLTYEYFNEYGRTLQRVDSAVVNIPNEVPQDEKADEAEEVGKAVRGLLGAVNSLKADE